MGMAGEPEANGEPTYDAYRTDVSGQEVLPTLDLATELVGTLLAGP